MNSTSYIFFLLTWAYKCWVQYTITCFLMCILFSFWFGFELVSPIKGQQSTHPNTEAKSPIRVGTHHHLTPVAPGTSIRDRDIASLWGKGQGKDQQKSKDEFHPSSTSKRWTWEGHNLPGQHHLNLILNFTTGCINSPHFASVMVTDIMQRDKKEIKVCVLHAIKISINFYLNVLYPVWSLYMSHWLIVYLQFTWMTKNRYVKTCQTL